MIYEFSQEVLLARRLAIRAELKDLANYAAASFETPRLAIRVFACLGNEYLRLGAAQPAAGTADSSFSVLFPAGHADGYLTIADGTTISDILTELSGVEKLAQSKPTEFLLSPLALMVLLGACDAVLKGRYEGEWFTANSVQNAFDMSTDADLSGLCAPLAYVASELVYQGLTEEKIKETLDEMVEEGVLKTDNVDDHAIYVFEQEYRDLPVLFGASNNRLALLRYLEGETTFHYFLTGDVETWALTVASDIGKIEKVDPSKLGELFDHLLALKSVQQDTSPRFCTGCGAQLGTEVRFCAKCGKAVRTQGQA